MTWEHIGDAATRAIDDADRMKTCVHSTEEYRGVFSCQWTAGRDDIPTHLADGGCWLEKGACDECPCWSPERTERRHECD